MIPRKIQAAIDKCRDAHGHVPLGEPGRSAPFVVRMVHKVTGKEFYGVNFLDPTARTADTYESANGDHICTVMAPLVPTREEVAERLFAGDLGGGMMYCDRTVENHGDYKRLAFQPKSSGVYAKLLEWREGNIPVWLKAEIERVAAGVYDRGQKKKAENDELERKMKEVRKAQGWPGY